MSVVAFDPAAFAAQYPEFSGLAAGATTNSFNLATLYCNNTDSSIVTDIPTRTTLLYLLTAHITKLQYGTNDGTLPAVGPTDVVGRISEAKEGTVEARADMGPPSGSAAWFNQTRYGAMYWAATVRFRSATYVPFLQPTMNKVGNTPAIWPWGRW
jgi:hypothetical protein